MRHRRAPKSIKISSFCVSGSTHTRAVACAGASTFIAWIGSIQDVATKTIDATRKRRRATLAELITDIAATVAVGAIIGEALSAHATKRAVVKLTRAIAIAPAPIAFVVDVRVLRLDEPASTIRTIALFSSRARVTKPRARAIAAYAIDAETAEARTGRRTRRPIAEIACDRARPCSVAVARRAFVLRVGSVEDIAANSIAAARERPRAAFAELIADIAATVAVDAIVAQALAGLAATDAVQSFARALAVASIQNDARRAACWIGRIIRHERAGTDGARQVARFARVVAR